jgi:hypothetical protein
VACADTPAECHEGAGAEPAEARAANGRIAARLRAVIALATAAMVGLSWPLWTPGALFPRVPFVRGLPALPDQAGWVVFLFLEGSLIAAAIGFAWRYTLGLSLILLGGLILDDQHRFQPWAYQYLAMGLLLIALGPGFAVRYGRWWIASIYVYSGLSKLDRSFCDELGRLFLSAGLHPFGVDPESWPASGRVAAILAMPVFEVAVGCALGSGRLRRVGLAGALALHGALVAILGPWALAHSTIVLVWNLAMMVEAVILFGPRESPAAVASERVRPLGRAVIGLFWVGVLLPLGERVGLCDAWPAHALYASHVERTSVELHEAELGDYPESIQRRCSGEGTWRRLDLTGWSRDVRGVPVYPQARACNGLAEALAARYGGARLVRVTQWGRATILTGARRRDEFLGPDAIRAHGNTFWLNAHPAVR